MRLSRVASEGSQIGSPLLVAFAFVIESVVVACASVALHMLAVLGYLPVENHLSQALEAACRPQRH